MTGDPESETQRERTDTGLEEIGSDGKTESNRKRCREREKIRDRGTEKGIEEEEREKDPQRGRQTEGGAAWGGAEPLQ